MVFIVAEIGVNFGDMREAEMMIGFAKRAGADAVKFQVYSKENLYKAYPGGDVLRNPECEQLRKIVLDKDKLQHLKRVADECGIEFFATPMFTEAVDWLNNLEVERFKIRYADRHNTALINKALDTGKQVIISCDFEYHTSQLGYGNIAKMFCVPEYPPDKVWMPRTFSVFTGYSNHFPLIGPPLAAAARGAKILEVHVKQEGTVPTDDAVSITFGELTELVKLVREIEEFVV